METPRYERRRKDRALSKDFEPATPRNLTAFERDFGFRISALGFWAQALGFGVLFATAYRGRLRGFKVWGHQLGIVDQHPTVAGGSLARLN